MRVTVEDGASRLVIEDSGDEPVAKDWAAWDAAHSGKGTGKPAGKKDAAAAVQEAHQTLEQEHAGGKPTRAELRNAHLVHEAHEAHLAHEKAEQEKAEEAKGTTPAPAKPAAAKPAGTAATAAKAAAEPQRYVLAVAYQPGFDKRIQKGVDGGRDAFTEAELEKAAFSFLASGNPQIGIGHADGSTGAAQVVESYIYRNEIPWDIGNGIVVTKGTWLIGAILDPVSWQMALSGRLNGMSPQGTARRQRVAR